MFTTNHRHEMSSHYSRDSANHHHHHLSLGITSISFTSTSGQRLSGLFDSSGNVDEKGGDVSGAGAGAGGGNDDFNDGSYGNNSINSNKILVTLQRGGRFTTSRVVSLRRVGSVGSKLEFHGSINAKSSLYLNSPSSHPTDVNDNGDFNCSSGYNDVNGSNDNNNSNNNNISNTNSSISPLCMSVGLDLLSPGHYSRKIVNITLTSYPCRVELASFAIDASRFAGSQGKGSKAVSLGTSFTVGGGRCSGSGREKGSGEGNLEKEVSSKDVIDVRMEGRITCWRDTEEGRYNEIRDKIFAGKDSGGGESQHPQHHHGLHHHRHRNHGQQDGGGAHPELSSEGSSADSWSSDDGSTHGDVAGAGGVSFGESVSGGGGRGGDCLLMRFPTPARLW